MRPLRKLVPTPYVYKVAFLDKFNDSRYDNNFRAPYKGYADSLITLGTKKYAIITPGSFYSAKSSKIQLFPSIKKYDDRIRDIYTPSENIACRCTYRRYD